MSLLSSYRYLITFAFIFNAYAVKAQDYALVYENNFEQATTLDDFEFTDAAAWKLSDSLSNRSMDLFTQSNYQARVRSPFNIALLKSSMVGSFVLEVDLKQTGREYGHRDMCLFFGMKDPTNFYYVHLASAADEHAHNIFIVNDEPRRRIGQKTTDGVDWGEDWNKVRVVRSIEEGTIKVFFNDMNSPIMEAQDTHFTEGYVGFGSFDDTGRVDNIKLYGNATEAGNQFFKTP